MKSKSSKESIQTSKSDSQSSKLVQPLINVLRKPLADVTSEIDQKSSSSKAVQDIQNPEDCQGPYEFKLDLSIITERIEKTEDFYSAILTNYLKIQKPPSIFLKEGKAEFNPSERGRFLDWYLEIGAAYKFNYSTFFLTASILDEYHKKTSLITKSNLHLTGACCIYLASRFNDVQPLSINQAMDITYNHFTREQIQKKEQEIFSALSYELNFPNSFLFLTVLLRKYLKLIKDNKNDLIEIAYYVLKLCTFDYNFQTEYTQSEIAAGCITYATFLIFQGDREERTQLINLLSDSLDIKSQLVATIGTKIENNIPNYFGNKGIFKSFHNLQEQGEKEIQLLKHYNDQRS